MLIAKVAKTKNAKIQEGALYSKVKITPLMSSNRQSDSAIINPCKLVILKFPNIIIA
jgi:hypothetical protein